MNLLTEQKMKKYSLVIGCLKHRQLRLNCSNALHLLAPQEHAPAV